MLSQLRQRLWALLSRADARLQLEIEPEWLKTYRVYSLLAGVFVILSGFAYRFSAAAFVDPVWIRVLLSLSCLAVCTASFISRRVALTMNHTVYSMFVLLSIWIVGLAAANHFAADYSVTLVFFVAATSLSLSFVPSARLPLLWYQMLMTAVVTAAVLFTDKVETGRVVLVGCMAGIAFVTDVAAAIRARLEKDREEYRNNLLAANRRAEEMLRLKSSFINNMNHELRTPLTGILGFAEMISETAADEQRAYAHVIHNSGRRLMDTLSSILDLAHLEAGCFDLRIESMDLNATTREAVSLLESKARNQNLTLAVELAPQPVLAQADFTAAIRIIYNLVSNGIKFTKKGSVTVTTYELEGRACVSVEDTGIGIDRSFLPHIFDEFKQASSGHNRSHEGSGLGLTVTKRLIELMNGNISVSSAPGAGSKFTVSLPMADGKHYSGDGSSEPDEIAPEPQIRNERVL